MASSGVAVGGDWPQSPAFTYSAAAARRPLIVGVASVGNALIILALAIVLYPVTFGGQRHDLVIAYFLILVVGGVATLSTAYLAWLMARSQPALAVTGIGVFAFHRGKPWRSLGWDEILSITRLSGRRGKYGPLPVVLVIKGRRFTLQATEKIDGYDWLRELLARYARDRRVPLRDMVGRDGPYDIDHL